jgi:large subunit ribosomal protein L6
MRELKDKIEIPSNVQVDLSIPNIKLKGPKGEAEKKIYHPSIKIEKQDKFIVITAIKSTKKEKKLMNTIIAHIKNLIKGVLNSFEYEMKICSGHFPMNVSVEKNELVIKNFFGEKIPRRAKILPNVTVKVSGDKITVSGCNREDVGQTCSNIEQGTRRTSFDRRVYQDGIWITKKIKKI